MGTRSGATFDRSRDGRSGRAVPGASMASHDGLILTVVPRAVQMLLAALAGLLLANFISLIVRSDSGYSWVFEGVVTNVALAMCATLCFWRAWLVPHDRAAFVLVGIACTVFTAGNVTYVTYVQYLDPVPFPTIADVGYLGIYPPLIAGVLLLGRSKLSGAQVAIWLDGLVGVLGVASFGAALVLPNTLDDFSGDRFWSQAVSAAYPLADLLVVSMLVGLLAMRSRRPDRQWFALAGGSLTFAIADITYVLRLNDDSYEQGTLLDAFWVIGLAAIALSAWQPTPRRAASETASGAGSLSVTIVASILAIIVLVTASFRDVPAVGVGLSAVTLLVALIRTAVAFHLLRQLVTVRRQAATDDLTGLANRRAFSAALDNALATRNPGRSCALLLLDLDRFKNVNDLFGHQVGDGLLQEIGPRLLPVLRPTDLLGRLGGDEFGILLETADSKVAKQTAREICDALLEPFVVDGVLIRVGGTVGIARCPADADTAQDMFQCADVAMYAAKARRSGVEMYDAEHGADGRDRLVLATEIRSAVTASDQLVLHYQPKLDLRSGLITGVEALVRWQHPSRGLLSPDSFLAIAEQTGSLRALTANVLPTAIAQCQRWRTNGLDLAIAVNLSASDLTDDTLVDDVAAMLTSSGVPADALHLEITETTLMADPQQAIETLRGLSTLGIELSIDDYGTGFSSLSYLRDLPVQCLKIDQAFITDLTKHSRSAAIVQSTIDLAHALGLRVVAEGVETNAVMTMLQDSGCDVAQGYIISKPLPADELTAWLRSRATRTLGVDAPGGGAALSAPTHDS